MLADHLTEPAPAQLASAVLTVLAGTPLDTAATDHGLHPAELAEAISAYQTAGYAALERRAEQRCHQVLVQFPDWEQAETLAANHLAPRLDDLQNQGLIDGWWFLRKHPCWRLRLRDPRPSADTALSDTLTDLTYHGTISGWRPSIYEPEYAAFGGPTAMAIVHALFCADSRGLLDYARTPSPRIGRRELSILLIYALANSAGLDWFETGDLFHRVARLRPTPDHVPPDAMTAMAEQVRTLVHSVTHPDDPVFGPAGPATTAWRDAFHTAGKELGAAAAEGRLNRGLRALLTHVVIFHWNRLGLPATTQGVLARAATTAFLANDN